jgi:large subunit ribosomal protein L31
MSYSKLIKGTLGISLVLMVWYSARSKFEDLKKMREAIHPEYKAIKATCSCGNEIEIKSTITEDLQLDVCSECHPFYTGKQKLVDTGGRVDKFKKRFGNKSKAKVIAEAPAEEVVAEEAPAEEEK